MTDCIRSRTIFWRFFHHFVSWSASDLVFFHIWCVFFLFLIFTAASIAWWFFICPSRQTAFTEPRNGFSCLVFAVCDTHILCPQTWTILQILSDWWISISISTRRGRSANRGWLNLLFIWFVFGETARPYRSNPSQMQFLKWNLCGVRASTLPFSHIILIMASPWTCTCTVALWKERKWKFHCAVCRNATFNCRFVFMWFWIIIC